MTFLILIVLLFTVLMSLKFTLESCENILLRLRGLPKRSHYASLFSYALDSLKFGVGLFLNIVVVNALSLVPVFIINFLSGDNSLEISFSMLITGGLICVLTMCFALLKRGKAKEV